MRHAASFFLLLPLLLPVACAGGGAAVKHLGPLNGLASKGRHLLHGGGRTCDTQEWNQDWNQWATGSQLDPAVSLWWYVGAPSSSSLPASAGPRYIANVTAGTTTTFTCGTDSSFQETATCNSTGHWDVMWSSPPGVPVPFLPDGVFNCFGNCSMNNGFGLGVLRGLANGQTQSRAGRFVSRSQNGIAVALGTRARDCMSGEPAIKPPPSLNYSDPEEVSVAYVLLADSAEDRWVTASTCGGSVDTYMVVKDACGYEQMTVAMDDDGCSDPAHSSVVTFLAQADRTYVIYVRRFDYGCMVESNFTISATAGSWSDTTWRSWRLSPFTRPGLCLTPAPGALNGTPWTMQRCNSLAMHQELQFKQVGNGYVFLRPMYAAQDSALVLTLDNSTASATLVTEQHASVPVPQPWSLPLTERPPSRMQFLILPVGEPPARPPPAVARRTLTDAGPEGSVGLSDASQSGASVGAGGSVGSWPKTHSVKVQNRATGLCLAFLGTNSSSASSSSSSLALAPVLDEVPCASSAASVTWTVTQPMGHTTTNLFNAMVQVVLSVSPSFCWSSFYLATHHDDQQHAMHKQSSPALYIGPPLPSLLSPPPLPPPPPSPSLLPYVFLSNASLGTVVLDANVTLQPCNIIDPFQKFMLRDAGHGFVQLVEQASGLERVVQVPRVINPDRSLLKVAPAMEGDTWQLWSLRDMGGGQLQLSNARTGLCADNIESSVHEGNAIQAVACSLFPNSLIPVPSQGFQLNVIMLPFTSSSPPPSPIQPEPPLSPDDLGNNVPGGGGSISTGTIAGVVIAAVATAALLALAGLLVVTHCRRHRAEAAGQRSSGPGDQEAGRKAGCGTHFPNDSVDEEDDKVHDSMGVAPWQVCSVTMPLEGAGSGVLAAGGAGMLAHQLSIRERHSKLMVKGLVRGEPFLRGAAQYFSWTDLVPGPDTLAVEEGITAAQLDTWISAGAGGAVYEVEGAGVVATSVDGEGEVSGGTGVPARGDPWRVSSSSCDGSGQKCAGESPAPCVGPALPRGGEQHQQQQALPTRPTNASNDPLAQGSQAANPSAYPSRPLGGSSPVVRLSSTQVTEQIEVLKEGLLGRGATALVFKCRWSSRFGPHALLAIKVLRDPFTEGEHSEHMAAFAYEAYVLKTLRHPNVVRIYGWCLEPPTICLIMELLPSSLKARLRAGSPSDPASQAAAAATGHAPAAGGAAHGQPTGTPSGAPSASHTSTGGAALVAAARGPGAGAPAQPGVMLSAFATAAAAAAVGSSSSWRGATCSDGDGGCSGAGGEEGRGRGSRSGPAWLHAPPSTLPLAPAQGRAAHEGEELGLPLGGKLVALQQQQQQVDNRLALSTLEVLRISRDVATGLAYLHQRPTPRMDEASGPLVMSGPTSRTRVGDEGTGGGGGASGGGHGSNGGGGSNSGGGSSGGGGARAMIVHRDIKPDNVLLNSRGVAKISDFGLARTHNSTTVYSAHVAVGTLRYMAPELLDSDANKHTSNRIDIYSLGMLMWEMVSGEVPWKGLTDRQITTAVQMKKRPPLTSVPSNHQQQQHRGAPSSLPLSPLSPSFLVPHVINPVPPSSAALSLPRHSLPSLPSPLPATNSHKQMHIGDSHNHSGSLHQHVVAVGASERSSRQRLLLNPVVPAVHASGGTAAALGDAGGGRAAAGLPKSTLLSALWLARPATTSVNGTTGMAAVVAAATGVALDGKSGTGPSHGSCAPGGRRALSLPINASTSNAIEAMNAEPDPNGLTGQSDGSGVPADAPSASWQQLHAPASFERLPQLRTMVAACWQHNNLRRPTAQAVARTLSALLQSHLGTAGLGQQ